ncbi:hypothetical protein EVAR_74988_1 [Eumeta japonica]|uniref:Uncharacterized protein n=1 Tax=Eumeta variegata TaxID=151549 RepID=A0A4C1VAE0_EUMVA|nr:hypothetical protein EVAR_74988_1 [Eumeta japonica]
MLRYSFVVLYQTRCGQLGHSTKVIRLSRRNTNVITAFAVAVRPVSKRSTPIPSPISYSISTHKIGKVLMYPLELRVPMGGGYRLSSVGSFLRLPLENTKQKIKYTQLL